MSHFLVVDDQPQIRDNWKTWLVEARHTYEEAGSYIEAHRKIRKSEQDDGEPFDMILLDHELDGGFLGIDLLQIFGANYAEHRVIVITGHYSIEIARMYGHYGVLGHLLKPTSREQFFVTVTNALERRSIYVEQKEDWESAVQLLQDLELLPNIERMQQDLEAFEALRLAYERLVEDWQQSGGNECRLRDSYNDAYQTITTTSARVESIIPFLRPFQITKSLWEDIEYTFTHERLKFYGLQSYLARIANNPTAYRVKHLSGDAPGHYEYRTGITHRLYFRHEGQSIVLERFAHKNQQPEVMRFLRNTGGGDVYPLPGM